MIINQINQKPNFAITATSKDILYNEITYGADGKIVGDAPISSEEIDDVKHYKFLNIPNGIKLTSNDGSKSGIYKESYDDTWIPVVLPEETYWSSICYGNGMFVAVSGGSEGKSNIAAYSEDGIAWIKVTLPSSAYWRSVCYGNGKFVAVGGIYNSNFQKAAYSTDGVTWTSATLPASAGWSSVCYGNGKFIAISDGVDDVGYSSIAAYSEDGITWTQTDLKALSNWCSVCYGNGKFVALSIYNQISYSEDGIVWTTTKLSTITTNTYAICYDGSKFIIVTSRLVAYSFDAITWTAITLETPAKNDAVCYGNGIYVAITKGSNKAAYSEDGIFWIETNIIPSNTRWSSICYGNGKFITITDYEYDEDYNKFATTIAAYCTLNKQYTIEMID